MIIIADHICAITALAATSVNSLNYATLQTSYKNAINPARALHSSGNLSNQFAMLVTENEDVGLKRDPTSTDHNVVTARAMQLEAQLTQTLAVMTATTHSSPAGHKGQTDPEKFTGQDHSKLRYFVALLFLHLIDCPREFLNEKSKLQ
jgi:hypothetical protein